MNKYKFEFDLTHDKNVFSGKNANGYYELIVDDYPFEAVLKIDYKRFDNVVDLLCKECGEKSYTELEEENIRLKNALEDREELIESYEERIDLLRERGI